MNARDEWLALCAEFNGRCVRCGDGSGPLTKDRIVPGYRGGTYSIDNVQPFCGPCNEAKGSNDCTDYVSYRRRYGFEVEDQAAAYAARLTFAEPPSEDSRK